MTTLDPHTVILTMFCLCVGYVMLLAGVSKNALEWKRQRRVCPSCGRRTESCVCQNG
jgi:hypothetical protein